MPIIVLFLAVSGFAQEKPKAVLVDEFGQISCDDFLSRIDNFYNQINNYPSSKGYFEITGSKEFLTRKLYIELLFESAVLQRGQDRSRTTIIRGKEAGPFEVKIWLVGVGTEMPELGETKWDLRMPPGSPPFELRSDMAQICDPPPIGRVANDLVNSNPDGSIFVVVHGPNHKQRQVELWLAKKMLSSFSPSRVHYLLRLSNTAYSDYYFATGSPKRTDFKSYF